MARNLGTVNNNLLNALAGQETSEAILLLLTISHDDLSPSIRVTSDAVLTTSNSNQFLPYPFRLTLPDDPEKGFSSGKLIIDNVSRDIVVAIRSISTPPLAIIQLVLGSDPDTIYVEFNDFKLANITYNALSVTADLVLDHFIHEPFPGTRLTPSNFPGLF